MEWAVVPEGVGEQAVAPGLAEIRKSAQPAKDGDNEELDAVPSQASATRHYDAALQRKEKAHSVALSVTEGVGIHEWK